MIKSIRLLFIFLLTIGVVSFIYLIKPIYACCSNSECGGATCADTSGCPGEQGTCTGGGTECGSGVGAGCTGSTTCVNGDCVVVDEMCSGPNAPSCGSGTSCCGGECVAGGCGVSTTFSCWTGYDPIIPYPSTACEPGCQNPTRDPETGRINGCGDGFPTNA